MSYKEFMIESLTDILEDGEILMYPIYGSLCQGSVEYRGCFGLTEKYLLIALVSEVGKEVTHTMRVPLDIKTIRIEQSFIAKKYSIYIVFNEGAPCRITASPKVLTIDTQKDNLAGFFEKLRAGAPQTNHSWFDKLSGEIIRTQYFNCIILLFLSFVPMFPIMSFIMAWKKNGEISFEVISDFLKSLPPMASIWAIVLIPLLLLSLLNRFCFGKVICVLDEKGIHLESGQLSWNEVKSISFQTPIHSRFRHSRHNCATFSIKKSQEYEVDVLHFPFYALRKIKKYCPDVKIVVRDKGLIVLSILCPTIISIILPFLY